MSIPRVRVGDVLSQVTRSVQVEAGTTFPMIGVRSFGKGAFPSAELNAADTKYLSLKQVNEGDLVYPKLMAWEGAFAVVPSSLSRRFVTPEFCSFEADWSALDIRFLEHLVSHADFRERVAGGSSGTNVRRRRIYPSQILDLVIPLPDIAEQRRIATRLDRIEAASRAVTASDFMGAKSRLHESLVSTKWPTVSVDEVAVTVSRKVTLESDSVYRMLGVRWYGHGLFVREVKQGREIAAKSAYRVEAGDLVYNRLFAWKGSFALADEHHAGCFVSNEFPTYRLDEELVDLWFIRAAISTDAFTRQADERSTGSTPTSRNRLKVDQFAQMTIPLPPRSTQRVLGEQFQRLSVASNLAHRRQALALALLPAARNEEFAKLR